MDMPLYMCSEDLFIILLKMRPARKFLRLFVDVESGARGGYFHDFDGFDDFDDF